MIADRNTTIRASQLRNFTISAEDIKNNSVTGLKLIDSTISGVKIADGVVSESKLDISNSPVDGYYLKYTTTSGMEWFAGGGGVTDHGALTGLTDDDHTQYVLHVAASGTENTFAGSQAGGNITSGEYNVGIGYYAGYHNQTGTGNVSIGYQSGGAGAGSPYSYSNCVFIGYQAASSQRTASQNVAVGYRASMDNQTGLNVTAVGFNAGKSTTANGGTFIGAHSSYYSTSGASSVSVGGASGYYNVTGEHNVFVGYSAGYGSSGNSYSNNVVIGYQAGLSISGTGNVFIGHQAAYNETGSNKLYISNSNTATPLIYGEFDNNLLKINGNVLPATSGTRDLGSIAMPWKDLYMTGDSIYMNGSKVIGTNVSATEAEIFSGEDKSAIIGKAHIGYNGSPGDIATFAHKDKADSTSFGFQHTNLGVSIVNAADGKSIYLRVNNFTKAELTATSLDMYDGIYITTDEVRAHDVSGLYLRDDSGSGGILIEDGGVIKCNDDVVPATSGTKNLGSDALPWKDLYLTGDSIYMDGTKVISMSGDGLKIASGDLGVNEIKAIDSSGLSLKDDAGTLAIFIEDGGKVGIGGMTPSNSLDVKTTLGVWNAAETRGVTRGLQAEYADWWYYNGSGWSTPLAMSDLKSNMSVGFMDGWVGIANIKTNYIEAAAGTSINEFSTDGALDGDSDNAVPTEKAVKTYVDSATGNSSGCRVYRSTTQSITQNTWTKVQFDTEVYDNQSEFDNTTNYRFTAKVAGVYNVTSMVTLDNLPDTYTALIAIYLNGTIAFYGTSYGVGAITDAKSVVTLPLKLAVGDYIEICIFQNYTAALNVIAGGAFSYLAVQKITAASEHGSAHENSSYVMVSEHQSSGTNGGGFTSGAWRTRVINTEDSDPDGICSISSNQITLDAGTYECRISAPAYKVDKHALQLYNDTDSEIVLVGQNSFCDDGDNTQTRAHLSGRFTIAASKALEVQHQCTNDQITYGLGVGHSFGVNIYTIAEFWKISEDGSGSGSGFSSRVSVYLGTNQTGVVTATWTKVELDTELFDGLGEFDKDTNHRFTANTAGYYQINGCVGHEGMGDADTVQTAIYVNGSRIAHATIDTGGTSSPGIPISKLAYLAANDYVELWGRHTLGSNGAFDAGAAETYLTVHRVS